MATDPNSAKSPSTKDAPTPGEEAATGPILVDIGKAKRKDIKKLRNGKPGKLLSRVSETLEHLREAGTLAEDSQVVVIVVRQRPRARRRLGILGRR